MAMSSRIVRASKYRHVYGEPWKSDCQHLDLDLSTATGDHNFISANTKFFSVAVRGGGGPVLVRRNEDFGKVPRGAPTITGHSANVLDTAWNPFNENMLATSSDDTTVKLWQVPDEGVTEKMSTPLVDLTGSGKSVTLLRFHPTANNILASASKDMTVRIWDVEKQEAKSVLEGFGGLLSDLQWNHNGSRLITSCKDKMCRIYDPRGADIAAEFQPHEGAKPFKTLFLGRREEFLTVGFTRQSKREFKLWDPRKVSEPIRDVEIDQAAGVMMPFFDESSNILFLQGKGDGNIRYYELVNEAPYFYQISEYRSSNTCKGITMLPKRSVDVMRCEIVRFLRLLKGSVETISFFVPRKDESFQEDLFPDCYAGRPSLQADEWYNGKDADPKLMSMDPSKREGGPPSSAATFKPVEKPKPKPATAAAGGGGGSGRASGSLQEQLDAAKKRIAELEAENAALKKQLGK